MKADKAPHKVRAGFNKITVEQMCLNLSWHSNQAESRQIMMKINMTPWCGTKVLPSVYSCILILCLCQKNLYAVKCLQAGKYMEYPNKILNQREYQVPYITPYAFIMLPNNCIINRGGIISVYTFSNMFLMRLNENYFLILFYSEYIDQQYNTILPVMKFWHFLKTLKDRNLTREIRGSPSSSFWVSEYEGKLVL